MGGKAIIFSAPSGSGKTTIVQSLLKANPKLQFSISATTRNKRPEEVDGRDYHFLSESDFRNSISRGELVEFEEVYAGTFYGTLKSEIDRIWSEGNHVVFDVDVKGGMKLKEFFGDRALSVFVKVPSIDVLRERLAARNTESEETLRMRIDKAAEEMKEQVNFDKVVVNEVLEKAKGDANKMVSEFLTD